MTRSGSNRECWPSCWRRAICRRIPRLHSLRLRSVASVSRRDVVLLTHPRSLLGAEVVAAARALGEEEGVRVFAIAIDSRGRLELAELRRGLAVVLARSRIDLVAPECLPQPEPTPVDRPIRMVWKGCFESIGFPFQTGVLDAFETSANAVLSSFDFDEAGGRILIVGRHGLLFSCLIDGTEAEILPRPRVGNTVVNFRRAAIGVAGGFVLEAFCDERRFLAHYDFPGRTCNLHEIHDVPSEISWLYYRDLHAVAGLPADRDRPAGAIDLGETPEKAATSSRANRAAARANAGVRPYPLTVSRVWTSPSMPRQDRPAFPALRLESATGTLQFDSGTGSESAVTPLVDGQPALRGCQLVRALQGGDVLAILVEGLAEPALYFLSVSTGSVLGLFSVPTRPGGGAFALSRDGERLARSLDGRRLELRDVPGDQPPFLVTPAENLWIHFATLGRSCLLIRQFDLSGPRRPRLSWLLRWDQGRLDPLAYLGDSSIFDSLGGVVAVSRSVPTGNHGLGYDPERFVQMIESRGLRILIDRYNHLAVLGRGGELVCMMFVSFHEFAAWLPDGTVLGDRRLIGGEATPGAAGRIAARSRTRGGRRRELAMTIQVPFHLRRRSNSEAAVALYLPSREPRDLVALLRSPRARSARPRVRPRGGVPARARAAAHGSDARRGPPALAWRRPCTSRSTPSWFRRCSTTRRAVWYATGGWCFRRAAARFCLIGTLRSRGMTS